MPRGDGTGPIGLGEMTGRGVGYCAGYEMPGYGNPIPGRGFGAGFGGGARFRGLEFTRGAGFGGGGRGRRNWYWATGQPGWMRSGAGMGPYGPYAQADPGIEKTMLRSQAEALKVQLDNINQRLSDLEATAQKD